jgi:large subunit ribosomal protein LP2
MKYIAAYALLVLGGKAEPSAADVEKVLKEAGIKSETEQVERMIAALKGKKFHELVTAGKAKMASMGPVQVAAGAPAAGAKAVESKKEEKKEEKEPEADVDMGGLFGDEY